MSAGKCKVCRQPPGGCDPACALVKLAGELERRWIATLDAAESLHTSARKRLEDAAQHMLDARDDLIAVAALTSKRELHPCDNYDVDGCPARHDDYGSDCALCAASKRQQWLLHFGAKVDAAANRAQLRYAAAMRDAGRAHLLRPEER